MISAWVKNMKTLTWLRIGAALVLAFLSYWIFSDLEIKFSLVTMLIPLTYLFSWDMYSSKSITILVVPILVNIALWRPCYYSYLFLRVVLYAERIKLYCLLAMGVLMIPSCMFMITGDNSFPVFLLLVITPLLLYYNIELAKQIKVDKYKQYFHIDNVDETKLKNKIRPMALGFIALAAALVVVDYNLQINIDPNTYKTVYKRELIYSRALKYRDYSTRDPSAVMYNNKPSHSVSYQVKLSRDDKMLLMRVPSLDDDDRDLFIFDLDSMKNTKILKAKMVANGKRAISAYTFTPDKKYIIVGDELKKNGAIKFQVLNIVTGELDNRFSDPKGVVEKASKNIKIIEFNPTGNYFAVVSDSEMGIEIWDYESGQPICALPSHLNVSTFTWLADNKFLISYYPRERDRTGVVCEYEILRDGSVIQNNKAKIAENMSKGEPNVWRIKSSLNGQYIFTLTREKSSIADLYTVDIWDVNSEQHISSIERTSIIHGIEFHPNGTEIMILEGLSDKTGRVSFWDIKNGKKNRDIKLSEYLPDPASHFFYNTKLTASGKKLIVIDKDIHFIDLE